MTARIDAVHIVLDLYDEFEGRRAVVFAYQSAGPNDPFIAAVRQKWDEWYAAQEKIAAADPHANDGFPGFG